MRPTGHLFMYSFFETNSNIKFIESEVKEIMQELSFQMLRLDTAKRTKGIRELLVARALYATCIEPERKIFKTEDSYSESESESKSNWQDDQDHIFASWSSEE